MKKTTLLLVCLLVSHIIISQNSSSDEIADSYHGSSVSCISEKQYVEIQQLAEENIVKFGIKNNIQYKSSVVDGLDWPLRKAEGFNDCSYYIVTNFVDQDKTSGVKDYNCGTRTYNGHRGTDITLWPYPQYKQEQKQVEVIAAKTGVIVNKADGFFDQKCVGSDGSGGGNYVMLQHSDGSRTLYYHMKKNSITTKAIGATIQKGEYLGTVASSGSSGTPHLHFEVWADNKATLVDPYSGTCNGLNVNSLWNEQKPYLEPIILKVSIHKAKPITPACPEIETLNEAKLFTTDDFEALFYIHKRDEELNVPVNLKIKNPDGSTFSSWSSNGTTTWNGIVRSWLKTLPKIPGVYTFEAELHGNSCSTTFEIVANLNNSDFEISNSTYLFPNPSKGTFTIQTKENLSNGYVEVYNVVGQLVLIKKIENQTQEIHSRLQNGMYFYKIKNDIVIIDEGKLLIE